MKEKDKFTYDEDDIEGIELEEKDVIIDDELEDCVECGQRIDECICDDN